MSIELTFEEYNQPNEGLKNHSKVLEIGEYFIVINLKWVSIYQYCGDYDTFIFLFTNIDDARDLCSKYNLKELTNYD